MLLTNWRFWLALVVSALFMLLLLYQVDLGEIRSALLEANYLYVAPAIALYFVAVYFRSVRWRYLLSPLRTFPVSRLYPVIVIGYMANNLLPARLGELVRSYYLARRENFNASAALATIAVERVYDGVTLLAFAAVSAPILFMLGQFDGGGGVSRTAWILVGGLLVVLFLGALVFLTCLAVIPRFLDFVQWCTNVIPARWGRNQVQSLVLTFVEGLKVLSSPRQHLALFVFSLPVWLLESSTYYLVGYAFGIDQLFSSVWVFLLVVLLLTATSNLATSVPTAIGGIGPFEVKPFHQPEIGRLVVVFCYLRLDELIAVGDAQARVVAPLVADCREFPVRHSRPADRARTMRRVDDRLVAEAAKFLQGVEKKARDFFLALGIEIGASDIADEQGIAGKDADRSLGIFAVMDDESEMIVGVSRCFKHFDLQLTQLETIAFARSVGEGHVSGRIGTVVNRRTSQVRKDRRAAEQILIAMGFEDMRYLQPFSPGPFDIDLEVPARIDDRCLSARTDDVGKVREARGFDLLQKHTIFLVCCSKLVTFGLVTER